MLGLTLLSLALATPGAELSASERAPALVMVALPPNAAPAIPAPELIRAADAAFRARTGLDLRAPEQAGVDGERLAGCEGPGRLACWLTAADERPLAAILVITALPVGSGRDRVVLTLIDTARAGRCQREPGLPPREATEALEDCIWAGSARTEPEVLTAADVASAFEGAVGGALSPLLDAMGQLAPFGQVRLDADPGELELRLDGRLLGLVAAGPTTLTELRPGRRVLELQRPGYAPRRHPVHVARGETATAAVSLLALNPPPLITGDRALLYAGGAAAAAGLGLAIYAAVRARLVDGHCLVATPDAPCQALGAPTFGLSTEALPNVERDAVNPPGVPVPAVAAGVGLAGVGWLAGALIFEEEDGFPWRGLITGLAAGAAGALVAALADPR